MTMNIVLSDVNNAFFLKEGHSKAKSGTYFRSSFGGVSKDAVAEFVEWLFEEDFDESKLECYIEKVKEAGYMYALPCINDEGGWLRRLNERHDDTSNRVLIGSVESVLDEAIPDDANLTILFEKSTGEQVFYTKVGKFTLYKLIHDNSGKVCDSVMYVADTNALWDIGEYMSRAVKESK